MTNYHASLELFDLHSRNYFEDREQLNEFCAAETVRFLEMTHAFFGNPKFLVLKHPFLTRLFTYLHQLLPEAKFVISLRDPRDHVASAVASQQDRHRIWSSSESTRHSMNFTTRPFLPIV